MGRRHFLIIVAVAILVMLSAACSSSPKDAEFSVRVEGTAGQKFSGSIMVIKADGSSVSESMTSDVPWGKPVKGTIVSASMQKQDDGAGTLRVRILKGSQAVAEGSTSAAYGVVAVAGK